MRANAGLRVSRERLAALRGDETRRFLVGRAACAAAARQGAPHHHFGVPMHWMRDGPAPATWHVKRAQGARLTTCGRVPPRPGFLEGLQDACARHGSLLVLDETPTLSGGLGGHARVAGLRPDLLVVGKAVAGGLPCAVYGFTESVAQRMEAARRAAPDGHSGVGTTLSASLLAMAALRANLAEVMSARAHERMDVVAADLAGRLCACLAAHRAPWCVTRLGAHMELPLCATPPADAVQARAAMADALDGALHPYLLNCGILITPFHHMLPVSRQTTTDAGRRVAEAPDAFIAALRQ